MQKNALNALIQAACFLTDEQFTFFYDDCLPLEAKPDVLKGRNDYLQRQQEILEKYRYELNTFTSYLKVHDPVIVEKSVKLDDIKQFIETLKRIIGEDNNVVLKNHYGKTLKIVESIYKKIKKTYEEVFPDE